MVDKVAREQVPRSALQRRRLIIYPGSVWRAQVLVGLGWRGIRGAVGGSVKASTRVKFPDRLVRVYKKVPAAMFNVLINNKYQ